MWERLHPHLPCKLTWAQSMSIFSEKFGMETHVDCSVTNIESLIFLIITKLNSYDQKEYLHNILNKLYTL